MLSTALQQHGRKQRWCAEEVGACILGAWQCYLREISPVWFHNYRVSQILRYAMLHVHISAYQQAVSSRLCKEAARDVSLAHQAPLVWALSFNKSTVSWCYWHLSTYSVALSETYFICRLAFVAVSGVVVLIFSSYTCLHPSPHLCTLRIPFVIA